MKKDSGTYEEAANAINQDFIPLLNPMFEGLFLVMSHREDGNMKMHRFDGDERQTAASRKRFFTKAGIGPDKVVSVKSVHGNEIKVVCDKDCGKFIEGTDGLITGSKDVYLSITVADCLPVIIYAPKKTQTPAVCLLHCGWKGLAGGIISKAVEELKGAFDIEPEKLFAFIGPGIGKCHYDVSESFVKNFTSYPESFHLKDDVLFADLKYIAKKQLEESGISTAKIFISPICTYCQSERYFSHRKDKKKPVDAMIVIAGLKN